MKYILILAMAFTGASAFAVLGEPNSQLVNAARAMKSRVESEFGQDSQSGVAMAYIANSDILRMTPFRYMTRVPLIALQPPVRDGDSPTELMKRLSKVTSFPQILINLDHLIHQSPTIADRQLEINLKEIITNAEQRIHIGFYIGGTRPLSEMHQKVLNQLTKIISKGEFNGIGLRNVDFLFFIQMGNESLGTGPHRNEFVELYVKRKYPVPFRNMITERYPIKSADCESFTTSTASLQASPGAAE